MLRPEEGEGWPPRISRKTEVVSLNVINLDFLTTGGGAGLIFAVAVLVELETTVAVFVRPECVGLVDLGGVGEFTVGLP